MKKILFAIALLCSTVPLIAESDDVQCGVELEASKKIVKGLEASVSGEVRTQDGVSDLERFSIGAALSYKLTSWMKIDGGYVLMNRKTLAEDKPKEEYGGGWHYNEYWSPRHRAFASLSASWEFVKHFELSIRERYQYTLTTAKNKERYYIDFPEIRGNDKFVDADGEHLLRSRVQLKYARKKLDFEPYVSVELLNDLSDGFANDQVRYTVGTGYRINKHNQMGLSYRYKDKSNKEESKGHLITISYSYAF